MRAHAVILRSCHAQTQAEYVQKIDVCRNGCCAFWDSKHLPTPYKHAHRYNCLYCGSPRNVKDPKSGGLRAAKTFYFFPMAPWVRGLYARPDLVPYLYSNRFDPSESAGSVRRSRGWQKKMVDDPRMAADHRNLGIISTTDGVPFFRDQRRSGWPSITRWVNFNSYTTIILNIAIHFVYTPV